MTFRARVLLALASLVVASLAAFALAVRRTVTATVTDQYRQRVEAQVRIIGNDLARQDRLVASRLATIAETIAGDNRFRRGALAREETESRGYVLDYAGGAMRVSGLDMLQIQDEQGRIVSSGHFRNEFDLLDPGLPHLLAAAGGGMALVRSRTPEGSLLTLARLDSVRLGQRRYTLAGGVAVEPTYLGRVEGEGMTVTLVHAGDYLAMRERVLVVSELTLPYVETSPGADAELDSAKIVIRQSTAPLDAVIEDLNRLLALALAVAGLLALLVGIWLASRISRPLADLAEQTAGVDLDRLDVSFHTERRDEIGTLTRFLDAMTQRLRSSVRTLKAVERRAAVGDLARQVNHDIKNGLVPIRNVFKHWSEVARDNPAGLAEVFRARQQTVQAAVEYLERLATSYASLTPKLEPVACDLSEMVRGVAAAAGEAAAAGARVHLELAAGLPVVRADPVALKRILENLVKNALEGLDGAPGTVTVATTRSPRHAHHVRITVADTGPGMTQEQLDQAFSGFYTTKPGGTGLGLSIVRRLVLDLGGALSVETEPGRGTSFTIDLPAP